MVWPQLWWSQQIWWRFAAEAEGLKRRSVSKVHFSETVWLFRLHTAQNLWSKATLYSCKILFCDIKLFYCISCILLEHYFDFMYMIITYSICSTERKVMFVTIWGSEYTVNITINARLWLFMFYLWLSKSLWHIIIKTNANCINLSAEQKVWGSVWVYRPVCEHLQSLRAASVWFS